MKKGTRLESKNTELEVIYLGKNKHDKTTFKGIVVVEDKICKVGYYSENFAINQFQKKLIMKIGTRLKSKSLNVEVVFFEENKKDNEYFKGVCVKGNSSYEIGECLDSWFLGNFEKI